MNIGSIVYDCQSGLGILARDFYKNGIVNRVVINPHPNYKRYPEWYAPEAVFDVRNVDQFLKDLDILLLFENAFLRWDVVYRARKAGVKIVMMPMYEYTPMPMPIPADYFICPSRLDYDVYLKHYPKQCIFLPVPVDKPWRQRERAMVFIHNAGHGGKHFRNGTPELIAAMEYTQAKIKLIIRAQPESDQMRQLYKKWQSTNKDDRITFILHDVAEDDLYSSGDVFIFPEKFNGLSLPLQEAFASGMLVMATDRYPIRTWLPLGPLIPVCQYEKKKLAIEFNCAVIDPVAIASKIDAYANQPICYESNLGKRWAEKNSWEALKPQYLSVFESVKGGW